MPGRVPKSDFIGLDARAHLAACGEVRYSVHLHNDGDDVDRALDATREVLAG